MSFVRAGPDSDVYVWGYAGEDGKAPLVYICDLCLGADGRRKRSHVTTTLFRMYVHLGRHLQLGHQVPARAFLNLEDVMREAGPALLEGPGRDVAFLQELTEPPLG